MPCCAAAAADPARIAASTGRGHGVSQPLPSARHRGACCCGLRDRRPRRVRRFPIRLPRSGAECWHSGLQLWRPGVCSGILKPCSSARLPGAAAAAGAKEVGPPQGRRGMLPPGQWITALLLRRRRLLFKLLPLLSNCCQIPALLLVCSSCRAGVCRAPRGQLPHAVAQRPRSTCSASMLGCRRAGGGIGMSRCCAAAALCMKWERGWR